MPTWAKAAVGTTGIVVAGVSGVGVAAIAEAVIASAGISAVTDGAFYTVASLRNGSFSRSEFKNVVINGAVNGYMFGGAGVGVAGIRNAAKSGKLAGFMADEAGSVSYEGGRKTINPNEIRYSQSSVNGSNDIIQSMRESGWKGEPIDVVEMPDGIYTTIDNTRVVSAREAGINVKTNVHGYNDPLPNEYIDRFTTKKGVPKTWGKAIELRVGKQKASFRNGNPYGKFDMETIK